MTLQAGTLLIFGIDTPEKSYGLLQSVETTNKVQRAKAIAPDGAIVSIQEFGKEDSLSISYLPISTASTDPNRPQIGEPFIFSGSTWQVDTVADIETVDGFEAFTVEASYYAGIH
jgi:hypothetical protein